MKIVSLLIKRARNRVYLLNMMNEEEMPTNCPICFEAYTIAEKSKRKPKALLCGHSMCGMCVLGMKKKICGICRAPFNGVLTDHYHMMGLIKMLEDQRQRMLALQSQLETEKANVRKIGSLSSETKSLQQRVAVLTNEVEDARSVKKSLEIKDHAGERLVAELQSMPHSKRKGVNKRKKLSFKLDAFCKKYDMKNTLREPCVTTLMLDLKNYVIKYCTHDDDTFIPSNDMKESFPNVSRQIMTSSWKFSQLGLIGKFNLI